MKKKCGFYPFLCIVELLIFFCLSVGIIKKESYSYSFWNYYAESGNISTEEIPVPKGIYEVTVSYEIAEGSAVCYAQAKETGVHSLYSDHVKLSFLQNRKSFDIYVNDDVEMLRFMVQPEKEGAVIREIELKTAANSKIYQVVCLAGNLLLANVILAVICFRKRNFKRSFEAMGIALIGMIASAGLLEEYILYGHDLAFHLLRIEGIKEGLLAGDFPVKMQPNWFNGWGYPASVMYGDLLLYFPAALRLVGVSVQNAYKAYIGAVNFATAAIAYYAFFKISKNKTIAMFGSCLYTLSPYRLCCIYIRAALGEYSAMMFLPLVLLCFWQIFEKEEISPDMIAVSVIGFSGLIQTHVLSCFLTAFMIFIFCLINWRKMANKRVVYYFLKIGGITAAVNLWFFVPFLQYMGEDLVITASAEMTPDFQKWGANLAELFAVYWNGTIDISWGEITTIARKFPKPVGTAYLLIFFTAMLMYHKGRFRLHERKIFICMSFFLVSVAMASTVFPYYEINRIVPWLGRIFAKIQFPYRFLTMAGLFGSLLGVFVLMEVFHAYGKSALYFAAVLISLLAAAQGAQFIYSALYRGDYLLAYDMEAFENNTVFSGEYLYNGSWGPATEALQTPVGYGAVTGGFEKKYHTMTLACQSQQKEAFVLMPQYYYIGYEAHDIASGEKFEIVRSQDNNRIQVNLPEGYTGTLQVSFKEPYIWRLAEAFSLAVVFGSMFYYFFRRRKAKNVAQPF